MHCIPNLINFFYSVICINMGNKKGFIPWNKGLTKETSESVKRGSINISKSLKGKPGHGWTETQRKHLSNKLIEYYEKHPDRVGYIINHKTKKSFPEKVFENALKQHKIKGWKYNYKNSVYLYDFAFPELKIDVEIDGDTHKQPKVIEKDKRRDEFSKSRGWLVLRFNANEVKLNVNKFIKILKKEIHKLKN